MAGRFMELVWNLSGQIDPSLTNSVQQVSQRLGEIGSAAGKLKDTVGGAISGIAKVGALLTGGAFAAGGFSFSQLANNAASFGNELNTISSSLGISASSLSKWIYAAEKSEVSAETFKDSFKELNKKIAEAAQGSDSAQLAFKRAGVNILDSSGKIKSTEQILLEISDTFAEMPEGIYKADLAVALFSEAGAGMVPMLQQGRKAIEELNAEAAEMGLGFSDDDIKASAELQSNWDTLGFTVRGLAMMIGKRLLPVISPVVQSITDWVNQNNALINTKVDEAIDLFGRGVTFLRENLPPLISKIKEIAIKVNTFVESAGGWEHVLKLVAAAFIGLKAIEFGGWLFGVAKAFGGVGWAILKVIPTILSFSAALLTSPITWIVLGIAALVAAGYWLYKNWDKVVLFITDMWQGFKNYIFDAISGIKNAFDKGFIQGIIELFKKFNPVTLVAKGLNAVVKYIAGFDMFEYGAGLIQTFRNGISQKWEEVKSYFTEIYTGIVDEFDKGFINGIMNLFKNFNPVTLVAKGLNAVVKYIAGFDMFEYGAGLIQTFRNGISQKWEEVKSYFTEIYTGIVDEFDKGFINGIMNLFKNFNPVTAVVKAINDVFHYFTGIDMIQVGSDFIQSFADGLLKKWEDVKGGIVTSVTGWLPEWAGGSPSSDVSIPAYANGGLVSSPQVALIGEDGPEMVIPLTKPHGRDLLMQAAGIMGIGKDINQSIANNFSALPETNNIPKQDSAMIDKNINQSIANSFSTSSENNNVSVQSPVFAPNITITGTDSATAEKLEQAVKGLFNDFKRQFDEHMYQQSRIRV